MKAIIVRDISALVLRPASKPKSHTDAKDVNSHARYYATITFNQIVLRPEDREVARNLIDVYFELFKEVIGETGDDHEKSGESVEGEGKKERHSKDKDNKHKEKGKATVKGAAGFTEVEDFNSRLLSAILTGVNRALPFSKIDAGDSGFVHYPLLLACY
jgi:ribosome biogenesis protein MAK21